MTVQRRLVCRLCFLFYVFRTVFFDQVNCCEHQPKFLIFYFIIHITFFRKLSWLTSGERSIGSHVTQLRASSSPKKEEEEERVELSNELNLILEVVLSMLLKSVRL